MTRVQDLGPAPIEESIDLIKLEQADAIVRNQSATSEGAPRLWALLSQDEEQAAHERLSSDEEQAARGARLQRGVQSVGEALAAHEL